MSKATSRAAPRRPPAKAKATAALPKKGDVKIDDPTAPPFGVSQTPSQLDPTAPMDNDTPPTMLEFRLLETRLERAEARIARLLRLLPSRVQAELADAEQA